MFTEKEMKVTLASIKSKRQNVLNRKGGSDLDYIRDLQTLIDLEAAANRTLDSGAFLPDTGAGTRGGR